MEKIESNILPEANNQLYNTPNPQNLELNFCQHRFGAKRDPKKTPF